MRTKVFEVEEKVRWKGHTGEKGKGTQDEKNTAADISINFGLLVNWLRDDQVSDLALRVLVPSIVIIINKYYSTAFKKKKSSLFSLML